jgi:hypothetical protein
MTEYHHIWGPTEKCWSQISFHDSQLLAALTVIAWVGMVAFFVAAAFLLLTKSDSATIAMLSALAVWLGAGIAAIRIRRGRRKLIRVQR